MSFSEMEKNLQAIKKAGQKLNNGEKLPMKAPAKKKEKKTRYPTNNRWFHAKRKVKK